jgi:hypothetical protein
MSLFQPKSIFGLWVIMLPQGEKIRKKTGQRFFHLLEFTEIFVSPASHLAFIGSIQQVQNKPPTTQKYDQPYDKNRTQYGRERQSDHLPLP